MQTNAGGQPRNPVTVMMLFVLTLGVYPLVWLWRTTKALDSGGYAPGLHKMGRAAVTFGLVAVLLLVISLAGTFGATAAGTEPGAWVLFVGRLYAVFGLAAFVYTLIAWWRIWRTIGAAEREARMPAISAGAMVGLFFVPFFNLYWLFYVPYRTQRGLNWLWSERPGSPKAAAPLWPPKTREAAQ